MKIIVLVQCKDDVGLVAKISGLISSLGANIVSMREYVDTTQGRFFARLELSAFSDLSVVETGLRNVLPRDASVQVKTALPKRVVLLVTKEHHCLSDLLIRHHFQTAGMKIECVIGNHESLKELCSRFDVPFFHISHEEKSKVAFEKELLEKLSHFTFDFIVLAKFMRILSPAFVARFPMKIVNIHHSFLPAFIGANPYRQAFERGVKLIGATAHWVTDSLDEGPILTQQSIPVDHTFGVLEMIRSGKEIEVAVLAKALRLICEDRTFVYGNKTVVFE
jgi:formyltetrahydrofolate deformylase